MNTRQDLPFAVIAIFKGGKEDRIWITLYFRFCWSNNKMAWKPIKPRAYDRNGAMIGWDSATSQPSCCVIKWIHQMKWNTRIKNIMRWYLINNFYDLKEGRMLCPVQLVYKSVIIRWKIWNSNYHSNHLWRVNMLHERVSYVIGHERVSSDSLHCVVSILWILFIYCSTERNWNDYRSSCSWPKEMHRRHF
jgi:hypothetical protein